MLKEVIWESDNGHAAEEVEEDAIDAALIREELRRIVSSRHFQTSRRGKEFLQYVVNQKIGGKGDLLKERLIGIQIFGRKPDYSTGDDPVVRVQAGDVRRRLERYHADADVRPDVLIEIPLGSYVPVFRLRRVDPTNETSALEMTKLTSSEASDSNGIQPHSAGSHFTAVEHPDFGEGATALPADVPTQFPANGDATSSLERGHRRTMLKRALIGVLVCLLLGFFLVVLYLQKSPEPAVKAFWSPASVLSKPVLLCLPRPMVYKPSDKLFERYRKSHPNTFGTREARQDQLLPLEPTDPIEFGDMIPVRNAGPGIGGVIAAVNLSTLLTEQGIRFELRFGDEATYAEMRDSPVVIIGGINTDWATQLTSELNFIFDQTPGAPNIHEVAGTKRVWKMESNGGDITRDYGMITRQLSGKAGQFLVQVAGCTHFGTQAASELLMDKKEFAKALRSESISAQTRNVQIVVSTDVTGGRAGPPHIVAMKSW